MKETLRSLVDVMAILVFLGSPDHLSGIVGNIWGRCILALVALAYLYWRSYSLLLMARHLAHWAFRWWIQLRIEEPPVGGSVPTDWITVRGSYRWKPDPKRVIVFHKADQGYYPQHPIQFREGLKAWSSEVNIGHTPNQIYTVIVARCSDDLLRLLAYFDTIKDRELGYQAIPDLEKAPGFCILDKIKVKYVPSQSGTSFPDAWSR